MLGGGPVFILECAISVIIGHSKSNDEGVFSGYIWVSAATTKMKTTRSCIMIGAPNVVAKFNAGGVFSILMLSLQDGNHGGVFASQQGTLDEQVFEMSSFSVNYDLQVGPPHIAVDEYAISCTEKFSELLCSDPDESAVQEFLEKHPWLVPGHATPGTPSGHFPLHCSLITQPKLPGQHVRFPDFMWIAVHSGAWFPTLIEIERPGKKIYRKNGHPFADFSQAENQLNQWRSWFTSNANVEQFKEMYGIPDYMLRRQMKLHMILVYGRRSELDEQPDLARQRGSLLSGDAEVMSFDRLLDPQYIDTRMKDAVTVRATGDGRYRAEYVPPVFSLGPVLAERLLVIDGWEEAIEKNSDISNERKMLLQRRIPYWKEWASLRPQGIYRPVDRE